MTIKQYNENRTIIEIIKSGRTMLFPNEMDLACKFYSQILGEVCCKSCPEKTQRMIIELKREIMLYEGI